MAEAIQGCQSRFVIARPLSRSNPEVSVPFCHCEAAWPKQSRGVSPVLSLRGRLAEAIQGCQSRSVIARPLSRSNPGVSGPFCHCEAAWPKQSRGGRPAKSRAEPGSHCHAPAYCARRKRASRRAKARPARVARQAGSAVTMTQPDAPHYSRAVMPVGRVKTSGCRIRASVASGSRPRSITSS